ncbi:MAG: hypothetical protein WC269_06220 [Candidatus Gracilibacteria bacterium]|jgi:hypothetical protein
MSSIYLSHSFSSELKNRRYLLKLLIREIRRFDSGLKNIVFLYSPAQNLKVFKVYLDKNKVRVAVLFKVDKNIFIPFFIARKESKNGWNLSKYSAPILANDILRIHQDVEHGNYDKIIIGFD